MSFDYLQGKSILITGGTGSFGQKIVNTLLSQSQAKRIIVFSRDELKQSQMQSSISDPEGRLRFFIGDVRDKERLDRAFRGVDFVLHAAALKQVPAMEYNPFEAVKTNILGTQNVINAALDQKVAKVILVSTDKAANPANLYGATKLCAERLLISSNVYSGTGGTKFSVVRYGNVLGSRGSLVEVINKNKATGVISLTHEDMTRFWVTLDQAVEFVLASLERAAGGEIFVPKIPSMKIKDLIVMLAPECEIKVVGIRPGEKLHEVLITPEEARHSFEFENHFVIFPEHDWWNDSEKNMKMHYSAGQPLDENKSFSSHTNELWLDEKGLKELLGNL